MTDNTNTPNPNEPDTKSDAAIPDTPAPTEEVEEEGERELTFAEMLEETLTSSQQEGEVVKGVVIRIEKDHVLVDIGFKSEGYIDASEFRDETGKVTISEGDEVEALIEAIEDEVGVVVLSKEKADKMKVWDEIYKAYNADGVVRGKVVARVKGGLSVDIGVRAFLPGSQVDLRPVRNIEKFIGQEVECKILKFNKRRGNIVLSRRALLEKEREQLRAETLKQLEEGAVLDGIVKNITDYGAFIDLGGIDGLLHITDMSWGRINHPSELFEVGDEVRVVVLKYDEERQRVSLGYKQIQPDPWTEVPEKFKINDKVKGKVVSLTDYGAFVELEEGVEGLIHVSEMSWVKKIKHPSKILAIGDVIEAVVLDINVESRRISLGLKQTADNPWDKIRERYPVGTRILGKIRNITDFGVFVGIDEGIDGLIHISDISWTQRIRHPSEIFKKGQEVEAVVLNIDTENERFSLGIKQLQEDPWKALPDKHRTGDIVEGTVINITEFGVFVDLGDGIEGLIHVSELSTKKVDDPSKIFSVGDKVMVEIIKIDERERKIRLSRRSLEVNREKADMADFMQKQGSSTVHIGDLIAKAANTSAAEEVAEVAAEEEDAPAEIEEAAPEAEEVEPEADEAEVVETEADEAEVEAEEAEEAEAEAEEAETEPAEEATEEVAEEAPAEEEVDVVADEVPEAEEAPEETPEEATEESTDEEPTEEAPEADDTEKSES
ncbi:MAG: 30S ribosomal protein S1 [Candidatus Lernaella stagnicola]|nr:30S ribosomal protein S1 [Candidatus Lernaella stagnicola]